MVKILLRRMYTYIKLKQQLLILLIAFVCTGFGMAIPLMYRYIIDEVIVRHKIELLGVSIIAFLCIIFFQGLTSFLQSFLVSKLGESVGNKIRQQIYDKLTTLDAISKNQYGNANIVSLFNNDVIQVTSFISTFIFNIVMQVIVLFAILITLFVLNTKLAIFSFTVIPMYLILVLFMGQRINHMSMERQKNYVKINMQLQEDIMGLSSLQIIKAIKYRNKQFAELLSIFMNNNVNMFAFSNLISQLATIIASLGNIIVICAGASMVVKGEITLGIIIASEDYISRLFSPIISIVSLKQTFQTVEPSLQRIFEFLDIETKIKDKKNCVDLLEPVEVIKINNLKLRYNEKDEVIKGISTTIDKGTIVAIVGESGCGKTSLCNIIARLLNPSSGEIIINNRNLIDYSIKSLREKIYLVQQEPMVYRTSIRDNIMLGEELGNEKFEKVSEEACLDFIHGKASDEIMGDQGFRLSGGEKRRIALARALIRDYEIIILDEPTAGLDNITRKHLRDIFFKKRAEGKTIVIISHDVEDYKYADKIIVLKNGKIEAEGKHEDLVVSSQYYNKLIQIKEDSAT